MRGRTSLHSFFSPIQTSSQEPPLRQKLENSYRMIENWATTAMNIITFDPEFYATPKDSAQEINHMGLVVGFACVATGLTTQVGRREIARRLLGNASIHAINMAVSMLHATVNATTKLFDHSDQPETSQQKEALNIICKRLSEIKRLVRSKQIPPQVVNAISPKHLYMIAHDSPNTDVSLFEEELLLVMELATRLGCHHIPTKILEQFHDLHHEDYLRLCIEAKNVTMFEKTLQMPHISFVPALFSMTSVAYKISSRVIMPYYAFSEIMSLYRQKPLLSHKDMLAFTAIATTIISVQLLGSTLFEIYAHEANNCADEERYLMSRSDMIRNAHRLNVQEIAALCIQNNPFLLNTLCHIDANMARKIVENILLHSVKLKYFVKNVNHHNAEQIVLPCLKALFPDAEALQDTSDLEAFCEQTTQNRKALKSRMKAVKLVEQRHVLFSLPRNVIDSYILPRLSDESIFSEETVARMLKSKV